MVKIQSQNKKEETGHGEKDEPSLFASTLSEALRRSCDRRTRKGSLSRTEK